MKIKLFVLLIMTVSMVGMFSANTDFILREKEIRIVKNTEAPSEILIATPSAANEIITEAPTPTSTPITTQTPAPTPQITPSPETTVNPTQTPEPEYDREFAFLRGIPTGTMEGTNSSSGFWGTAIGSLSKDKNGNDIAVYPNDKSAHTKALLEKYNAADRGNPMTKRIYLTFTVGFGNVYVDKTMDILHELGVPAVFFVTGEVINNAPNVIKKAATLGFTVGGHGYWHESFPKSNNYRVLESINLNINGIRKIVGNSYKMEYFRPPFGYVCERDLAVMNHKGLKCVFWTFLYRDYDDLGPKKAEAFYLLKTAIYPGSVLYLHATSDVTYSCLREYVEYVRALGYEFGDIGEIFNG